MDLSEFLPFWAHIFKRFEYKITLIFFVIHIDKIRSRLSVSILTVLNVNKEHGIRLPASDTGNKRTFLYTYVW
jgi:hypothetical protein